MKRNIVRTKYGTPAKKPIYFEDKEIETRVCLKCGYRMIFYGYPNPSKYWVCVNRDDCGNTLRKVKSPIIRAKDVNLLM